MSEWKIGPLTELAFYQNGYAFKPTDWQKEGLPIVRIEQINNPNASFDYFEGIIPAENHIDNGDIIFSWSATLKAVIWRKGRAVLNQHLFKVVPKTGFDKGFVFYILEYNMPKLAESAHGSTMRHIRRGELDRYTVTFPRKECEQRKIARILSTVDAVIEKTEAAIAKYKAIKQGMMRDLFTRGLDANGHLRPRYEDAPNLYKYTELGWVPKEWEIAPLVSFASSRKGSFVNGPFGSDLLTSELHDSGVPVIYVQDIKEDEYCKVSNAHVTEKKADRLSVCNVRLGDVLVAKVGNPPGTAAVYPMNQRAVVTQDVIRIRPEDDVVSQYLASLLNSAIGIRTTRKIIIEGTRSRVSLTEYKGLLFPKPLHAEQLEVANHITSVQRVLRSLSVNLCKLKKEKQGLMSDLLTGKKSVTADTVM